jgi:hypothetical protein
MRRRAERLETSERGYQHKVVIAEKEEMLSQNKKAKC